MTKNKFTSKHPHISYIHRRYEPTGRMWVYAKYFNSHRRIVELVVFYELPFHNFFYN